MAINKLFSSFSNLNIIFDSTINGIIDRAKSVFDYQRPVSLSSHPISSKVSVLRDLNKKS